MAAQSKKMPNYAKFVIGGLAGMTGTFFVQPLDLAKTRMQIAGAGGGASEYKNSFDVLVKVFQNEGISNLYSGLGAGLLRQATYTTSRMGVYQTLNDIYKKNFPERAPTATASIIMALTAGACGAFVGTPADVALIRMMADGKLPPDKRRNYKHVGDALIRIMKEEGVTGLWAGCVPTVGRAMIVNMCQLASYSQFKRVLHEGPLNVSEGFLLHLCASSMSGLLTSIASMPLDMAKTRLQNMKQTSSSPKPEYSGTFDVLFKVAKQEGILSLWKGFTPYFFRMTPHTILTFIFLEQYSNFYYKYILGTEGGSSM